MLNVVLVLILLGIWLYAFLDAVTTDATRVRNAPKLVWVIGIILLGAIGGMLWLWLGRPRPDGYGRGGRPQRPFGVGDEDFRRPRRSPTPPPSGGGSGGRRPLAPDDDPEFLRGLERRLRGDDS